MTAKKPSSALTELVAFTWHRSDSAVWVPWEKHLEAFGLDLARAAREEMRVTETSYPESVWLRTMPAADYAPLNDELALFQIFANLDGEDTFLRFAREYGPLRSWNAGWLQSLAHWQYETQTMCAAVRLWESLRNGKAGEGVAANVWTQAYNPPLPGGGALPTVVMWELRRDLDGGTPAYEELVKWQSYGDYRGEGVPRFVTLRADEYRPSFSPKLGSRQIAQAVLQHTITDGLRRGAVTPTLVPDGKPFGEGLRLAFDVSDLLGALWLQFAAAVDGNRKYEQCKECGSWWDATAARSHKRVCSDKCRAHKHDRLQKEAKQQAESEGGAER